MAIFNQLISQASDAPASPCAAEERESVILESASQESGEEGNAPVREPVPEGLPLLELAELLDQHREWVESAGQRGKKADLRHVDLEGAELAGVNLQGADLHKAKLRGADLSMANLQGASLVQADLQETSLLGTELRGANLMGANLLGAAGLWLGRLGRSNLFGAVLPDSAFDLDGTKAADQATNRARWFYAALFACALLAGLGIFTTSDLRLLQNASTIPLPALGNVLPMSGFYLGGPLLLFGLYLRLHFLVLRLWGSLAALPAVYPNGRTMERSGSWFLLGLARGHFPWQRESRTAFSRLETAVCALLAYWIVPAVLFLFWVRYLTRQDLRGTLLHAALLTAAVFVALALPGMVARILETGEFPPRGRPGVYRSIFFSLGAAAALGCLLVLVSFGILRGAAPDSRSGDASSTEIRRLAAQALWFAGYTPYADLNEAEISSRPPGAASDEETVAQAQGAHLNQMSLRYADGYRAFLVNARLWRADLEGARLSESDLRSANLREARLVRASLDRARAERATLVGADARGANFAVADLRSADLSYAELEDAILAQAKLGGATLYGAGLQRARLVRAELDKADLRDANLENAVLTLADLHDADLSQAKLAGARLTGAHLKGAMLLEADLRHADLHGAVLPETVLREALLDGANLDGADLRGALGLTAAQVCSAANWRAAQMDEALRLEVEHRCGDPR
ncbi:MAG: pentapeptide repeat-containing protein [Acidobacteriia bacterium]|nr:pentapeptide repeat-containing protein [Terriglobia bacterium]